MPNNFNVRYTTDNHSPRRWRDAETDRNPFGTKVAAEAEAFRIVHEKHGKAAEVVENQPVIVTHVSDGGAGGIVLTRPNSLVSEGGCS